MDAEGKLIAERDEGREAFGDHGFDTRWDPLNLAYFNGYAMWTYHALPFLIGEPHYELEAIAPVLLEGRELRGLLVRFPENIHTHTREQRLYFGEDGLSAPPRLFRRCLGKRDGGSLPFALR